MKHSLRTEHVKKLPEKCSVPGTDTIPIVILEISCYKLQVQWNQVPLRQAICPGSYK